MKTFLITLAVAVVLFGIYIFVSGRRLKKAVVTLTQEEFIAGYRKAQLIDLREQKDFEAGHILGARNIPTTQLRQRYKEMRTDLPVYLYDQNSGRSARTALFLKKRGYDKLYMLEGGFGKWTGKIKHKKSL